MDKTCDELSFFNGSQEDLAKQTVVIRALRCLRKQFKNRVLYKESIDDLIDAIACLHEAFDIQSDYEDTELNNAMLEELYRDYPGLQTLSTKIVKDTVVPGNKAFSERKYSESIKWFTKAILAACEDPKVYVKRGKAFSELEYYQGAISDCEMAVSLDPTCFEAYKTIAHVYWQLEHMACTVRKYEALVQSNPHNVDMRRWWMEAKQCYNLVLDREDSIKPKTVKKSKSKKKVREPHYVLLAPGDPVPDDLYDL